MDIKAKTRSQIAEEYGISRRTLYNWLNKSKLEFDRSLLIPKEVEQVYRTFGNPKVFLGSNAN